MIKDILIFVAGWIVGMATIVNIIFWKYDNTQTFIEKITEDEPFDNSQL